MVVVVAQEEQKALPGFNNAANRPKVRAARAGTYRTEMDPATAALFNATMHRFFGPVLRRRYL